MTGIFMPVIVCLFFDPMVAGLTIGTKQLPYSAVR